MSAGDGMPVVEPTGRMWRPGRRAVDQTAIEREHAECVRCLDAPEGVVIGWENGNAVWGPCDACA